jgi:hypothetical protein
MERKPVPRLKASVFNKMEAFLCFPAQPVYRTFGVTSVMPGGGKPGVFRDMPGIAAWGEKPLNKDIRHVRIRVK